MLDTAHHPHPASPSDPVLYPAGSAQAGRAQKGILTPVSLSTQYLHLTRMVRRGCFVRLSGGQTIFSIRLANKVNDAWSDSLFLETPGGQIEIADGARLILGLTGIHPGALQSMNDERGKWFAAALAGRLANTPFAGAHVVASPAHMNREDSCCLQLALRSRQHLVTVFGRAPAATWLEFLSAGDWTFERAPVSRFLAAETQETIQIAQHIMPAGALRTLALGDVIVPDTSYFLPGGEGRIRLGGRHAHVRYSAPGSLEIVEFQGEATTEDETEVSAAKQPHDEALDEAGEPEATQYSAPENT